MAGYERSRARKAHCSNVANVTARCCNVTARCCNTTVRCCNAAVRCCNDAATPAGLRRGVAGGRCARDPPQDVLSHLLTALPSCRRLRASPCGPLLIPSRHSSVPPSPCRRVAARHGAGAASLRRLRLTQWSWLLTTTASAEGKARALSLALGCCGTSRRLAFASDSERPSHLLSHGAWSAAAQQGLELPPRTWPHLPARLAVVFDAPAVCKARRMPGAEQRD